MKKRWKEGIKERRRGEMNEWTNARKKAGRKEGRGRREGRREARKEGSEEGIYKEGGKRPFPEVYIRKEGSKEGKKGRVG